MSTQQNKFPRGQFQSTAELKQFLLAGKAIITLKSLKTNEHYTFQVQAKTTPYNQIDNKGRMWFVKVLRGQNEWLAIGGIHEAEQFRFRKPLRGNWNEESPSFKAFKWFWSGVSANKPLPAHLLEVWHEGRCGRCGRPLTHPNSIASGIGPECQQLMKGQSWAEDFLDDFASSGELE